MMKQRGVNWEGGAKTEYPRIDGPYMKSVWGMVPRGTQVVEILMEDGEYYLVGHFKGVDLGERKKRIW